MALAKAQSSVPCMPSTTCQDAPGGSNVSVGTALTCAHAHTETHILKSENKSQGSDSSLELVTHLALSASLVICRVGPLLSP